MECTLNNNNTNFFQKHMKQFHSINAENPCEETVKTKFLTL